MPDHRASLCRVLFVAALWLAANAAHAVPFWGSKDSQPADTDPSALKPGQFVWAALNLGGQVVIGFVVFWIAHAIASG